MGIHIDKETGLTNKRIAFCKEYIIDRNATRAAKCAGYSEKTAYSLGHDLLKIPEVIKHIELLSSQILVANEMNPEWITNNLKEVVERCMTHTPALDKNGEPTGEYVFNAPGALKGLELLGRIHGLFIDKTVIDANITRSIDVDPKEVLDFSDSLRKRLT